MLAGNRTRRNWELFDSSEALKHVLRGGCLRCGRGGPFPTLPILTNAGSCDVFSCVDSRIWNRYTRLATRGALIPFVLYENAMC